MNRLDLIAMEEEERSGRGTKVQALIEKATNSTAPEVDPRLLQAIKSVVQYSDSELRIAAQTLMDLMKREHSQVLNLNFAVLWMNYFSSAEAFFPVIQIGWNSTLAFELTRKRSIILKYFL